MHRVLGVAAVLTVISVAGLAYGEEGAGWGNPTDTAPPAGETGGGWGNPPADTTPPPADPPPPPPPEGGGAAPSGGSGWGGASGGGAPAPSGGGAEAGGGSGGGSWGTPSGGGAATPPASTTPAAGTGSEGAEPAGPTGAAFRTAHPIAIGMHNHMSGAFVAAGDALLDPRGGGMDWTTPWMNVSFMYHVSELFTIDAFVGFMVMNEAYPGDDEGATIFEMAFGPRALFTLATFNRTRLYTGVALAMLIGYTEAYDNDALRDGGCDGQCGGTDMYGIALAAPLGFEYRFRSAPHLALSMEINFHFVYQSSGTRGLDADGDLDSQDLAQRVIVGMGNPRVTGGSANFFDFLNFLTLGLHYQL